jgi:DNA invertase Pin-like site-specific DNA recombinase
MCFKWPFGSLHQSKLRDGWGAVMGKLIDYARVSTKQQRTDRQDRDLLTAGVRQDNLYADHRVSDAHTSQPAFGKALAAVQEGDTLVIPTLDRLGRSTRNMLNLAEELRRKSAEGLNR